VKPDTWRRLETVFFAALELPPEQRAAYLDRTCGGDAAFRQEVDAVLAAHVSVEDRPGAVALDPAALIARRGSMVGTRIGAYRLGALVGRGGMAEVYRAQRVDEQYRQEVAVKLIRAGYAADELARRFLLEREVLARLQHPNIATLLDGGVTEDGRPYLVMQYVDGVPVTEYADARRLPVRRRLELVRTVCDAVQFAHANLVVHRDLKPTNILVTASGHMRLLDFGIAKLLDPERIGMTAPATEDLFLLTPDHAAPEQILGNRITTATDVFALGVLLYELLIGVRPFQAASPPELRRAVCESEPIPPSEALTSGATGAQPGDRPDPAAVANLRGTRPEPLARQLRGDLDQIVLMALRKEPERRYASAGQLSEDLGRFLAGRPVIAHRDSLGYRARRFARRNRVAVVLASAVAASLLAGLMGTTWQARRAHAEAVQAAADRDRAERVSALLVDMFRLSDPGTVRGQSVTAREILDRGVAGIMRDFRDQPELQAGLLVEVGRIYENLGLFDEAGSHLARALELRRAIHDEGDPRVAETLAHLARARTEQGRGDEALALAGTAVDHLRRRRGRDPPPALAGALMALGGALREADSAAAAGRAYGEAVALLEAEKDPNDALLAEAFFGWADAAHNAGEFDQADSLLQETVERYGRLGPGPYPDLATALYDLAMIRMFRERTDEAASLLTRALAMQRQIYGPVHPAVAHTLAGLMAALSREGRYEEAATTGWEAVAVSDSAWGPNHLHSAQARQELAFILMQRDEGEQAVEVLQEAFAILDAQPESNPGLRVATGIWLGQAYASMGRFDRAEEQYAATLRSSDASLGPEHPYHAHLLTEMSRLDVSEGRLGRAEARARESLALTQKVLRPEHRFALWATVVLAQVHAARGDLEVADSLARTVLGVQVSTLGIEHRETAQTLVVLADVETRLGRHAEAEAHARAALSALEKVSSSSPAAAEARSVLGAAFAGQGRRAEAGPLLVDAYRALTALRGARPAQLRAAEERLRRFEGRRDPLPRIQYPDEHDTPPVDQ
jgi:serine/threonine-protein kinase